MIILRLLRFVFGYVEFTACGGFPERFLNLCRHFGIPLWNVKRTGGVLTGFADRRAYKRIRPAARKSGTRVRIKKKYGLSFFLDRHSRRAGVIAGILIMLSMLCVLSTRIWSVTVSGNLTVTAEEICRAFENAGVKIGVPTSKIEIADAEMAALSRLPDIAWLNLNIRGSTAFIEVRERRTEKTEEEDGKPQNIVSAADGKIILIRSFNGTQEAKAGDPVFEGDLLISGIEENKDLSVNFCPAKGYIVARTEKEISSAAKRSLSSNVMKECEKSYSLGILGFHTPTAQKFRENAFGMKSFAVIRGVTLPADIICFRIFEREPKQISLSPVQAELMALNGCLGNCLRELRYVKTEKLNVEITSDADGCRTDAHVVCLENIGRPIAMEVEELSDEEINGS